MENNLLHLLEEVLEFYDVDYFSYSVEGYFNNATCINKINNKWEVCDFSDDTKHNIKIFDIIQEACAEVISRVILDIDKQDEAYETFLFGILFM